MKNCIIIHGGPLTDVLEEPHKLHTLYWQPWTKAALEKHDIPTFLPAMPHPWNPKYKEWKEVIEKLPVTAESVLIGHSRGVAFLLRWLGETKHRVDKIIMIAPNLRSESAEPTLQDFYTFDIDQTVQNRVRELIIFTSENDDSENMESAQLLANELNCRVVNLPTYGHFITEEMGTDEFPELVDEVIE